MAMTITSPMTHAADAIANNVQETICAEIKRVIHEHIDPVISEIAEAKARELCRNAHVVMQRDFAMPGDMNVYVTFKAGS